MTQLTLFTAPKPFVHPHISMIQRNAIRSWQQFGDRVEIFLVGDEEGIGETAKELGVGFIPRVARNASGTPLISSIFSAARECSQANLLAYVNADILLLPDFLDTALSVSMQKDRFLIVGQRWDLDVKEPLEFSAGWQERLQQRITREGKLHLPQGSDYFIFPKTCFQEIPDFAVGRAGWDNWMLFHARWMRWPLVNATGVIQIVHQRHDYSHLPDGQRHYRHPDSYTNIRLAGGQWAIFTLAESDHYIEKGLVQTHQMDLRKFIHDLPLRLHSRLLGKVFYGLSHPIKTYREVRSSLRRRSQNHN